MKKRKKIEYFIKNEIMTQIRKIANLYRKG